MEERMLQPRYENISMAQAGLTASGSALKLRASIKTFSRVNITITIKLQKKRDRKQQFYISCCSVFCGRK